MDYTKTLVMACATVMEEMLPLLPPGMPHQVFDFGLHVNPEWLRRTLQAAIDAVSQPIDTILLGYGLCSMAMIGICAPRCRLVVPHVDDCIAIFLGSRAAYKEQSQAEPGTYYLTKGWCEQGETPFAEYEDAVARFGAARAERIFRLMMAHYTRLALINTGHYEMSHYRAYARRTAERFGLRYEEIPGASTLVKKLLFGPWDDELVVLSPGEAFRLDHFYRG